MISQLGFTFQANVRESMTLGDFNAFVSMLKLHDYHYEGEFTTPAFKGIIEHEVSVTDSDKLHPIIQGMLQKRMASYTLTPNILVSSQL